MPLTLRLFAVSLLLTAALVLSVIIPPFQSPDETDHIKRAYLLGRGALLLDTAPGQSSGGMVDTGLLAYMNAFPPRLTSMLAESTKGGGALHWTGMRSYSSAPGTGYYFPLIYAPQAIGLLAGEHLGLTVETSVRLARIATLLAAALLAFAAFCLYPVNPLAVALLVLPMSLFQSASAGIDGSANALTLFSVACFMRIMADEKPVRTGLLPALTAAVLLLAMCRLHAAPLLLLPLLASYRIRDRRYGALAIAAIAAFLLWTLLAMGHTVDLRIAGKPSAGAEVAYYLFNPVEFLRVLGATIVANGFMLDYVPSFIGILGWLDASFSGVFYQSFFLALPVIAALSISPKEAAWNRSERRLLALLAVASVVVVFFALLVTWTPHPAAIIEGVQGRYFLIPALLLAYALPHPGQPAFGRREGLAFALCLVLFLVSVTCTTALLLARYYVPGS